MAQTFDIRFARSAGLAGLFEAPANEFRWKGAGRLSIDASGISIAVRRGLLTLFARARSHRIALHSLIEVYREGNALRLEFSTKESPRNVLPIWVSDRDAAAQIVTLLPTQRSVELEDVSGTARRYRFDRRLVALLSVGVAILGAGALLLQRDVGLDRATPLVEDASQSSAPLPTQDSTNAPPASDASTVAGRVTSAPMTAVVQVVPDNRVRQGLDPAARPASSTNTASMAASEGSTSSNAANSSESVGRVTAGGTIPAAPAKSAHEIAFEQFWLFRGESNALHADYLYRRDSLNQRSGMQALEERWRAVTSRIVNTEEFQGMKFYALREFELAVARNWRDHLSILAVGGDPELAAAHLAFAEALEAQLHDYEP